MCESQPNNIYEQLRGKSTTLERKHDKKGKYLNYIKGRKRLENTPMRRKEKEEEKTYMYVILVICTT